MGEQSIQSLSELRAELNEAKKEFVKKALGGKATWGTWRYNPDNLTLEIDSRISGYPKNNPYYVDLEQCNNSDGVLDWLLQLLEKQWCTKEQVGYLLQAINDLAGDLHRVIGNRHFNMSKHLRQMRNETSEKLFTVGEVARTLLVSKLTVYRMIKNDRLKAIRLPQGRFGDLRISETEVKKLLGKYKAANGE